MDYLLEFENLYKSIISNYENYNILFDIKNGVIEDMSVYEINEFISLSCASYIAREPDFNKLACHYSLLNIYNNLDKSSYMNILKEINKTNILSEDYKKYCYENIEFIDSILDFEKDKLFDFFGLRTLIKTYLLKSVDGNIIECPQHLFLREAIQVHLNKINNENIKNTYYYLSNLYYTHATPTLFNSGTNRSQLSSCFLMSCEDSIVGIAKSWENIAHISKYAGGIGISLSDIRGKNSKIKSTNGKSDGIVPLCKVYQSIALYVNQSGKRNGSIAIYLEPWHSDIFSFIDLRRITGDESEKTRDLFLGLWIPDIFMESVKNDTYWYLMSPDVCSGLTTTYGDEFKELYYKYVKEEKYVKKIKAVELYQKILESQIETGMPYMCYKDASNKKSNQKNLGTIKSSNLCSEVILHTSSEEIATCNLASISLPKFVNEDRTFNFELLGKVTELATYNLNNVIDVNYYPVKETENSNLKNRPLGLGVQGLVDTYFKMGYSFDSPEAFKLNRKIFECIYYHSVKSSNNMAKIDGTYSTFNGSPFSQGILQFHMWDKTVEDLHMDGYPDFQWNELIEDVKKYGTRNSQLTALMPTASTSQIMGNYECFEPFASNIFVRKMGKHDIVVINNHLVKELKELNLWNDETYNELLYYDGSIKNMNIPENLKTKYKTAFELQQSVLVKQSIERGCFIDQSQSLNIFMENPDFNKLNKAHFFGWQNGGCNSLKTGIYYLRSRAAKSANKFGLDPEVVRKIKEKNDDEVCLQCSA